MQHFEFLVRKLHFDTVRRHAIARRIQPNGAHFKSRAFGGIASGFLGVALAATQKRVHAADEFHHAERFRQIIIGSGIKTAHGIEFGRFRREHHDGNVRRSRIGTKALEHRNPIFIGQHHIEEKQIGKLASKRRVHFCGPRKAARRVARLLERVKRQIANLLIVLEVVNHPRTSPLYSPVKAYSTHSAIFWA